MLHWWYTFGCALITLRRKLTGIHSWISVPVRMQTTCSPFLTSLLEMSSCCTQVCHSDLKTSNILLTAGRDCAKVGAFAKILHSATALQEQLSGSQNWRSPMQQPDGSSRLTVNLNGEHAGGRCRPRSRPGQCHPPLQRHGMCVPPELLSFQRQYLLSSAFYTTPSFATACQSQYPSWRDRRSPNRHRTDSSSCPAGTFAYAAPEMLLNQQVSIASDIFSLGVMLQEVSIGSSAASSSCCMLVPRDSTSDDLVQRVGRRLSTSVPQTRLQQSFASARDIPSLGCKHCRW